jgi:hypothetical protein
MLGRKKHETPPIFADLVVDVANEWHRVDVDQPGWQERAPSLQTAQRVGLALKGEAEPRVWLHCNGNAPGYFSRVLGEIDDRGMRQVRVAGLRLDRNVIWLHRDGLVEVGPEPTKRV